MTNSVQVSTVASAVSDPKLQQPVQLCHKKFWHYQYLTHFAACGTA